MASTFMRCALKVDTQNSGWQASMDDLLSTIEDVSYNIDSLQGFAYVSGNINPGRFMRRLARANQIELCWADSRQINKNNPTVQEPAGYDDEYGQYRRLDYDYVNGTPIVQGGGYFDEYGQYRRYYDYANGYNLNHRYGAPGYGYGYGNNQYGRLSYGDDNCPTIAAQSSPQALPPVPDKKPLPPPPPVPEALKKGENKWINCCMM